MSLNPTKIPWCDVTWNPFTGCTKGCEYCYARAVARRFGDNTYSAGEDVAGVSWVEAQKSLDGEVFPFGFHPTIYPHRVDEPLKRKKPTRIFLGSMGDLFDPAFSDEFRDRVFAAVTATPQHTYILLTKQPQEMQRYFVGVASDYATWPGRVDDQGMAERILPNLWLGVTVTNQEDANDRIPWLIGTNVAHRFVSVEPMMGPIDLCSFPLRDGDHLDPRNLYAIGVDAGIDLVIAGAKTPGKPLHTWLSHGDMDRLYPGHVDAGVEGYQPRAWLRSLREQCLEAGVPFHYKHGGTNPELDGVVHDALGVES